MFVILLLALQFTEITGQFLPRSVVRDGDDVTLPCGNMKDDRCEKTDWLISKSQDPAVLVSEGRQVRKNTERLKVMTNCSLVIKKVSVEDVGFYTCRTIHSRGHYDANAYLFLITMTEKEVGEQVKLSCFVSGSRTTCKHTVEWMDEGKTVDDEENIRTSRCLANVVIPASFLKENPKYRERFSCKVKDDDTEKDQLFALSPQSPGNDANTTKPDGRKADVKIGNTPTTPLNLWLYIVVTVGLVALIITVVVIILWIRREDEKSIMLQDVEQNLNSAAVPSNPETSPNMADPEDEVSYATICHTKKAESKIWVKDGEEAGDSVTYSSVKVHSAEVSPDLYETINKSNE